MCDVFDRSVQFFTGTGTDTAACSLYPLNYLHTYTTARCRHIHDRHGTRPRLASLHLLDRVGQHRKEDRPGRLDGGRFFFCSSPHCLDRGRRDSFFRDAQAGVAILLAQAARGARRRLRGVGRHGQLSQSLHYERRRRPCMRRRWRRALAELRVRERRRGVARARWLQLLARVVGLHHGSPAGQRGRRRLDRSFLK